MTPPLSGDCEGSERFRQKIPSYLVRPNLTCKPQDAVTMSMKLHTRQLMGSLLLLLSLSTGLVAQQGDEERFSALIKNVRVNGVDLHYLEIGSGMPVVLIHGRLGDYREWNPQIERITSHYRVIAYSRRYNYPNNNPEIPPDHSAIVEARDLAALLDTLKLERVHIVGYSYGALTALFFATEHPERVRSLTMAEPPILAWLSDIPGGQTELNKFMQTMWIPAGEAFRRDDPEAALRITCDYFSGIGSYDQVPTGFKQSLLDNIREWKALTTSRDASRDAVVSLKLPILLITGEKTLAPLRMINDALNHLLCNAKQVTIPGATHDMWLEDPERCGQATVNFLAKH
jgi:pimeloyl-ACP methyl ester carboxylesterase